MGYWKGKGMEEEEDYEWARSLLCEVGALEECENHPGTYFDGSGDVEAAYKLANARITSGELKLNHVYFEKRSFSSSGSRVSLTQRRSAMTKRSPFRRASKSATRRVRSSALAWQW